MRRELIAQLTREFFAILWNDYHPLHARLSLDVLGGPHVERALLRVRGGMWCAAEQGVVPAVAAKTRAGAAFVVSTQAIELRRAEYDGWEALLETATLVDVVGTMALLSRDAGRPGVSIEMSQTFCAAAKVGERVTVVGTVLKAGGRLGFTQVEVRRADAQVGAEL